MNEDPVPTGTPGIADLVAAAVTWGATELLKRLGKKRKKLAIAIRRFLPLFAVALGVAIQVTLHTFMGGGTWQQALVKGVYTGASAVAAHNLYKATVRGELSQKPEQP